MNREAEFKDDKESSDFARNLLLNVLISFFISNTHHESRRIQHELRSDELSLSFCAFTPPSRERYWKKTGQVQVYCACSVSWQFR